MKCSIQSLTIVYPKRSPMPLLRLFAVHFFLSVSAAAQISQPQKLGVKDGINNVTVIEQDGAGMLWIGTADGLYSYDGANFRR